MQRLDQINALKPANLFDFKSLALKIRKKQIGRFKTVNRQEHRRWFELRSLRKLNVFTGSDSLTLRQAIGL